VHGGWHSKGVQEACALENINSVRVLALASVLILLIPCKEQRTMSRGQEVRRVSEEQSLSLLSRSCRCHLSEELSLSLSGGSEVRGVAEVL
jgi:hypothetical protein